MRAPIQEASSSTSRLGPSGASPVFGPSTRVTRLEAWAASCSARLLPGFAAPVATRHSGARPLPPDCRSGGQGGELIESLLHGCQLSLERCNECVGHLQIGLQATNRGLQFAIEILPDLCFGRSSGFDIRMGLVHFADQFRDLQLGINQALLQSAKAGVRLQHPIGRGNQSLGIPAGRQQNLQLLFLGGAIGTRGCANRS